MSVDPGRSRGLFDLSGKVAVVTGGNAGLGLAMARGMGEAGARVIIAARRADKAREALAELEQAGIEAGFLSLDVRSTENCRQCLAEVAERHGRIDILVNNAGISIRKLPQDLTDADWEDVIDINLTGAFRCAQAVFPTMRAGGGGKIINIGSLYSTFGAPKTSAYAASKGGIAQLTKSLATAWAEHGIQVNAILPGWVDTDLTVAARAQVEGLDDVVLGRTPAARWGRPDDIAGTAVFLAAPASDFVTGALIPVDGGYSARG